MEHRNLLGEPPATRLPRASTRQWGHTAAV